MALEQLGLGFLEQARTDLGQPPRDGRGIHCVELAELGQKIATETAEPIKATAAKYYKPAA